MPDEKEIRTLLILAVAVLSAIAFVKLFKRQKHFLPICAAALAAVLATFVCFVQEADPIYRRFDPESEGLIQIETQFVYGNKDKTAENQYYAIADGKRLMPCDGFESDDVTVYQVPRDCFDARLDGNILLRVEIRDEKNRPCEQLPIMDEILEQIATPEHEMLTIRIFEADGEYFVYVELNVNLWTPCKLYYYNQERKELVLLYTLSDEETTNLRILSAERLRNMK